MNLSHHSRPRPCGGPRVTPSPPPGGSGQGARGLVGRRGVRGCYPPPPSLSPLIRGWFRRALVLVLLGHGLLQRLHLLPLLRHPLRRQILCGAVRGRRGGSGDQGSEGIGGTARFRKQVSNQTQPHPNMCICMLRTYYRSNAYSSTLACHLHPTPVTRGTGWQSDTPWVACILSKGTSLGGPLLR